MLARDGPESMRLTAPEPPAVSRSISTRKRPTATGGKRTPKPKGKGTKKPHQPTGYEWRREGAGWDLRKVVWVDTATGGKQRKRPYLGHLSKSAFADMKKTNRGAQFEKAIARWIADHDR